jgi:hypothetical protein
MQIQEPTISVEIDLTPTEEARLMAAARQRGLTPAEFVKRLALEHLPAAPVTAEDAVDARLRQWQEQDDRTLMPDVPTQTLFAQWDAEDAQMTDAEREAEDRLWEAFQQGVNDSRAALGMRTL